MRGDADRIRSYLCQQIEEARIRGETTITFRAGDVRVAVGRRSTHNGTVCAVMRGEKFLSQADAEIAEVIYSPPSGFGGNLEIRYTIGQTKQNTVSNERHVVSNKCTLGLKNFRSVREATIGIAPLTVVYGPNGAGKSSLIYGLLTLKNFLTSPEATVGDLFSYPSIKLGEFAEVVAGHRMDDRISLSFGALGPDWKVDFLLEIGQSEGRSTVIMTSPRILESRLIPGVCVMSVEFPLPYLGDQSERQLATLSLGENTDSVTDHDDVAVELIWNGFAVTGTAQGNADPKGTEKLEEIFAILNFPFKILREVSFIPLQRGFFNPFYTATDVVSLSTEREVASSLIGYHENPYLVYEVSRSLERVVQRQVSVRNQIGSSKFTVDSVPRTEGPPVSMVNDGFGINQLAYLLTLSLRPATKIVAIEEPEIHLHPSIVRRLAHELVRIAKEFDRSIIVSTHSEVFVLALLAQIAAGKIDIEDVSFLLADISDGESTFTKQEVSPNGQIRGGLDSFIASELEDVALFLGIDGETTSEVPS